MESAANVEGSLGEAPRRREDLPEVSDEAAQAAREQVAQRTFVPSTHRPPDEVLPNPEFIRILDQGQEGVSVGVALAAALNYLRAEQGEREPVSPRMLYEYARLYDEWRDADHEGSSLLGGLAGLVRHGVCLDTEWPLYDPNLRPDAAALKAALTNRPAAVLRVDKRIEHLRAAVFEDHAVVAAAELHDGWREPLRGVIQFRAKRRGKAATQGSHAFALLGYTAEGFIVQNSWGMNWGGVELRDHHLPGTAIWTYDDATAHLVDAWAIQLSRRPYHAPLVGYDADSLEGDDLLEIKAEVNAFSYVLASRAIKPPMALGLFGDWGSGKSFFMQEMKKKIASLAVLPAKRPDSGETRSPFCRQIVQIRFNAWHYLDTDLWASLVTEIFDGLFAGIGGKTGKPEEKLPELAVELQNANGVYQQARQQLEDAKTARARAEATLRDAVKEREDREVALRTQLNDLTQLLKDTPAVKAQVDRLAADLGMPEMRTSYQALDARATELKSITHGFTALLQTMFSTPWGWPRLLWLIAAMCAPVLVVMGIELLRWWFSVPIERFHAFAVQLSTLLAAVTAWLGVQAKRGAGVLASLRDAHQKLEVIRATRRAEAVANQEGALQALREKEDAARKSMQDAEQRVQALQREIDDLQPGRLIMRFIEERTKSSDYRSRLGIVSLVRRDFERLSELADPDSDKRNTDVMPVERIILYIDDLDRCKPDRVIEVLEAVHLLLAFRLFMVVVAVDPRWLRRCLEKHYPDLLALRTQEVATVAHVVPSRPATAQDYLEKIFQIPFTLQPLKDDGYRRLIRGLTEQNRMPDTLVPLAGRTSATGAALSATGQATAGTESGQAQGMPLSAVTDVIKAQAKQALRDQATAEDTAESEESAIERLRIRAWELDDMERLAPLFHTPRAVKRFVNTYRFLRAGVRQQYLGRFEGERDEPGTYRAALTLLAIIVSYSNVAPRFLRRILDTAERGASKQGWLDFLRDARADAVSLVHDAEDGGPASVTVRSTSGRSTRKTPATRPREAGAGPLPRNWEEVEWLQLCDALLGVSKDEFPVREIGELEEWAHTVARYSFSLGPVPTVAHPGR